MFVLACITLRYDAGEEYDVTYLDLGTDKKLFYCLAARAHFMRHPTCSWYPKPMTCHRANYERFLEGITVSGEVKWEMVRARLRRRKSEQIKPEDVYQRILRAFESAV